MDIKKLVKYLIALIVIVVSFIVSKNIIFPPRDNLANGDLANGDISQQAGIDIELIKKARGLDTSIFDDPKFKSLKQGVIIERKGVKKGKKNIFQPK